MMLPESETIDAVFTGGFTDKSALPVSSSEEYIAHITEDAEKSNLFLVHGGKAHTIGNALMNQRCFHRLTWATPRRKAILSEPG